MSFHKSKSLNTISANPLSAEVDNLQSQILKRGDQKNACLGELKEFLPQIFAWRGQAGRQLTMFLVKNVFVKQNMALRAQFQVSILACFSQTTK